MLNTEEFINRLHKLLTYYSLSASGFADEINVQRSSISHLLSGRNKPSLEFVLKIVDHYKEVSLDWLLYGKGNFPKKEYKSSKENEPAKEVNPINKTETNNLTEEQKKTTHSKIERIVVFYKNGTFKEYQENIF